MTPAALETPSSRSSRASTLLNDSPPSTALPPTMDAGLAKTPSRRSGVALPEEKAEEEKPEDVIWVDWDSLDDPANPLNWSKRRKWLISSVGIFFCALVSLSVSGYSISENQVVEELHTTKTLALLGITTFTITFGTAPLLLAPLSEVYGRNWIYQISAIIFALFFLPQALAKNIETILVCRFISGIAGSTAVSLVGGTLGDVWRNEERGTPMAWFAWSAFASTGLGPVCFGYLSQIKGFRYVNWVLFAVSSAFAIICYFVLDETRASVLLSRKAARLRKETGDARYMSRDDFEHLFLVAIPLVYSEVYHFNTGEAGLVYITQFLGSCIGFGYDQYCMRYYHANVAKRGPEARLYSAFGAGVCVPVGAFIFCFTSYPQCHWIGSAIGVVILYTGMYLTYLVAFSYVADSYLFYASSALSAMSFVRNVVASVFPLFTPQMYDKLGIQGAAGLTAGLSTLLAVTPFILFKYGAGLRARSPFAIELARRQIEDEARFGSAVPSATSTIHDPAEGAKGVPPPTTVKEQEKVVGRQA